jgi:hypothetical protein
MTTLIMNQNVLDYIYLLVETPTFKMYIKGQ